MHSHSGVGYTSAQSVWRWIDKCTVILVLDIQMHSHFGVGYTSAQSFWCWIHKCTVILVLDTQVQSPLRIIALFRRYGTL